MKISLANSIVAAVLITQVMAPLCGFCLDDKKKDGIVKSIKSGVVSVFSSNDHGSGFVIDRQGLILTSSSVVGDDKDHLHVKLSTGKVFKAKVIVNDPEKDVAILRVNPEAVEEQVVLVVSDNPALVPSAGDELVSIGVGETNQESVAVVSKVVRSAKEKISLDSQIEPDVFGGPLLNAEGQVVGINTLGTDIAVNPTLVGVPISLIKGKIDQAREQISGAVAPSSAALPDVPEIPFKVADLQKENAELFKDSNHKDYNFESKFFSVCVLTPPEGLDRLKQLANLKDVGKQKNGDEHETPGANESYAAENYYDKAVVTVLVIPRPRSCKDSKALTATKVALSVTSLATIALGPAALPIAIVSLASNGVHDKRAVKKDFLELSLVGEDNIAVATPIASGKVPFTKAMMTITNYPYKELVDKSYVGMYTFDARAFDTPKKLRLAVSAEGKRKVTSFDFSDKAKQRIIADFKPYWDYVAKVSTGKQSM